MKQVLIKKGQVIVEEVPPPQVRPGKVLVCVRNSCISVGTEVSGIRSSGEPLWKRALQEPERIVKVAKMVITNGLTHTRNLVDERISAGLTTGYSAAGVALKIGEGVEDLLPDDRVACAGAQFAHHAEIICVPRNLVAPIPNDVDFRAASTVTLGAIALHGVRRSQPTLGEVFGVLGLGLLGQLTVQILKANGCRVIGTDLYQNRISLALEHGMDVGLSPNDGNSVEQVVRLTNGMGADGVIITAASPSNDIISTAFRMCRKKGRVVLVGDVGLNLNRDDFYQKELDFLISTSYGPGRYDSNYEEKNLDYPLAYVRWTENRNMAQYLRMLADQKVNVSRLISAIHPVTQAAEAYKNIQETEDRPLMVLLSYPQEEQAKSLHPLICINGARPANPGLIRLALVGAGTFAKNIHLPLIQALSNDYHLQAVVSRTPHNARAVAKQYGASYATTDFKQILEDTEVDAVLIATRHNLHAELTLASLGAGKHVLVEKPLALTQEELDKIKEFYVTYPPDVAPPILLTGFNRRFSPFIQTIIRLCTGYSNPMIINYRMNAGYIPLDHWVHTEEGGGRNLGEACHIYDLFTYLTDSKVVAVNAHAIVPRTGYYSHRDNFVATMRFEDGSIATLTYTSLGSKDYPKEQMEVFAEGKVFHLDDYKRLKITGIKHKVTKTKTPQKGHREELESFAYAIQHGGEWPIPLWQQVQAMQIALDVEA